MPERAGGVARFRFADLCELPLGATDYLELAREFRTLIIDDIPVMDEAKRNEAKRFINLIDALYDRHVKLIASAAAEPTELYLARNGHEAFQFDGVPADRNALHRISGLASWGRDVGRFWRHERPRRNLEAKNACAFYRP